MTIDTTALQADSAAIKAAVIKLDADIAALNAGAALPFVSSITPNIGSVTGGASVTIKGSGFTGATIVSLKRILAPSFVVVNDNTMTAVTPAGVPGLCSVNVVTSAGMSVDNTLYAYQPVTITPASGGSLTDAAGHVWTFSSQIGTDVGQTWTYHLVMIDGVWSGGGAGLMTLSNGVVWVYSSAWWTDNPPENWVQQAGPPPGFVLPPSPPLGITVTTNAANTAMDSTFMGLSFEKEQMCIPNYLNAANTALVALYRLLGPSIVLRFGGNEYCTWNASGPGHTYVVGANSEIAPADIAQLNAFVTATGSKVIYECPLWLNYNPTNEADEIAHLDAALGNKVLWYQFGNEPDLVGAYVSDYWNRWLALVGATRARVPAATFGGPSCAEPGPPGSDSAHSVGTWTAPFASDMAGAGYLTGITKHFYKGLKGSMTMDQMAGAPDGILDQISSDLQALTRNLIGHTPSLKWRYEECNSMTQGGQDRISNAFGAALWVIDFCFETAKFGCSGVNFHVGDFDADYAPYNVVYATGALTAVMPDFYGMLLVSQMLPGRLMDVTQTGVPTTLNTYAVAKNDGSFAVAVSNKSRTAAVTTTITFPRAPAAAWSMLLTNPTTVAPVGLDAYYLNSGFQQTTFGGASVGLNGSWTPTHTTVPVSSSTVTVTVPPASAMLINAN
jgi:hypothetical protein